MKLPAGKLPPDMLRSLLARIPAPGPSVLVGPGVGEDAAVLDIGGPELLVATTDPITFTAEDTGDYLLAVNGNDIATMGAEPRWLLVTALLPEGVEASGVEALFEGLYRACERYGVALAGGHTEITVGLERPILIGALLGSVRRDRLVRTAGARPGDVLLLAGGIAIEGTAILASEHAAALRERGVSEETLTRAAQWIRTPGISVLPAARAAHATGEVHSMHDPTEGGIATALRELAEAAGVGLRVERGRVPVLPECAAICRALGLDPLGLLASGALLITLEEAAVSAALQRLGSAGIPARRIGMVTNEEEGCMFVDRGITAPLPVFERDELARYLETDFKGGAR